jgi:heme-degrading monooxygenase HmoA
MFARTSTWAGNPEALERWAIQAQSTVRPFVEGLAGNQGVFFLIDREAGRALTLTLWRSEREARASDRAAEESRARTVAAAGVDLVERGRYEVVSGAEGPRVSP